MRLKHKKNKEIKEEEENEDEEDEEEDNEQNDITFLENIENNKNNLIIQFLNNSKNDCLDEILISLFDREFSYYFELDASNRGPARSKS